MRHCSCTKCTLESIAVHLLLNIVADHIRAGAIAEDVTDKALKAGYRHVR